jgi:hypothetical protein
LRPPAARCGGSSTMRSRRHGTGSARADRRNRPRLNSHGAFL